MTLLWRQTVYEDFDPDNLVSGVLWRGMNDEDGNYLWYSPHFLFERGIIAGQIGFSLLVEESGSSFSGFPTWFIFNGHSFWKLSDGNYLWYSSDGGGWVISEKLGACIGEEWDSDREEYIGHEWWGPCGQLEGTYEPRGVLRGTTQGDFEGDPRIVSLVLSKGYQRIDGTGYEAPAGIYEEFSLSKDGNVNVPSDPEYKYVGFPTWEDQNGDLYIRSEKKDSDGKFSYGKIYYGPVSDGNRGWLIGKYASEDGWYEGEEPKWDADVTFIAKRLDNDGNPEDDPDTDDLTISFKGMVLGDVTENILVAQVGMWL